MLLMVSVDDVTGETVSYVINEVLKQGANNVHVVPAITKKGRPEYLFYVDVDEDKIEGVGFYFAKELGTIGMRVLESRHMPFEYNFQTVRVTLDGKNSALPEDGEVSGALIRVKQVLGKNKNVLSVKADYEDLKSALERFQQNYLFPELSFTAFKGMVEQTVRAQKEFILGNLRIQLVGENDK